MFIADVTAKTFTKSSIDYKKKNSATLVQVNGPIIKYPPLNITKFSSHTAGLSCVNGQQEKPRSIRLQERAAIYLFNFPSPSHSGRGKKKKALVTDSESCSCLGV